MHIDSVHSEPKSNSSFHKKQLSNILNKINKIFGSQTKWYINTNNNNTTHCKKKSIDPLSNGENFIQIFVLIVPQFKLLK